MRGVEGQFGIQLLYIPQSGWCSTLLNYHEGIGPYFSLPEAIRRVEAIVGMDMIWKPI